MPSHDLWITDRCARHDLGLPEWPTEDGVAVIRGHRAVQKFAEMRGSDPDSGEHIVSLEEHRCRELHIDRDRGATWFDRENEVVFLLAVGPHEEGSRQDFYRVVKRLEDVGRLYPTRADYAALEYWRGKRWLTEVRTEAGPDLFERADAEPGVAIGRDLGVCRVSLLAVAAEDRIIGYYSEVRPSMHGPIDPALAERIVQALGRHRGLRFELIAVFEYGSYGFEIDLTEAP